jgi:hypothetical protein
MANVQFDSESGAGEHAHEGFDGEEIDVSTREVGDPWLGELNQFGIPFVMIKIMIPTSRVPGQLIIKADHGGSKEWSLRAIGAICSVDEVVGIKPLVV